MRLARLTGLEIEKLETELAEVRALIAELRSILERQGFRVVHHEGYWGGLGVLPEPIYAGFVSPLQKWWSVGESVARRQLMVATPNTKGEGR
jgi:hypothetical protein